MGNKKRKAVFIVNNSQKVRIHNNNVDVYVIGDNAEILCTGKHVRIVSVGWDAAITCTGQDTMVAAAPGSILSIYEPPKKKGAKSYVKTVYIDGKIAKPYTYYKMKKGTLKAVRTLF